VTESFVEQRLSSEISIGGQVGELLCVKVALNFFCEEFLHKNGKPNLLSFFG
jgi:hypothetical protein